MSFLTCEPNPTVGAIHPKAMPVMLDRNSFNRWLGDDHLSACELAVPYPRRESAAVGVRANSSAISLHEKRVRRPSRLAG